MAEEDEAKLLQDAKRLPFEDRLTHKHWKVRSEAYADVTKEAQWAENASSGVLKDFGALCNLRRLRFRLFPDLSRTCRLSSLRPSPGSLAHKCTADSNANALDGALDALVAFLGKADEDYAQRCTLRTTRSTAAKKPLSRDLAALFG